MNPFQQRIQQFADDRDWKQFHNPKDLLLGIVEEIGEIRNLVKWEQDPEKLRLALEKGKDELEDNIGDIYWFLALLANGSGIDLDQAIEGVIGRNEKRFQLSETKSRHTNVHLGGRDGNYN
jgi:dCTP diphosphatase